MRTLRGAGWSPRRVGDVGIPREVNTVEREFDRGYQRRRFRLLVADYPDESVYPALDWGKQDSCVV